MALSENMKLVWLTLYLKDIETLVVGDIHIGYEESLNKHGVLIPRLQFKEIMSGLENAINEVTPKKIILLGDIKHEFGEISRQEWRDTLFLLDFLSSKAHVILVKGNHDTILGPIAKKRNLEIKDYHFENDIFFCHGDKLFVQNKDFSKAKMIIIGHEHPAISIRDGARTERYKCVLIGRYRNGLRSKQLIVLPSINQITQGTDVLCEELLSPYIKDIFSFNAIIVTEEGFFDFGKLKSLQKLNERRK